MNDLLQPAIEAHGGLVRWHALQAVEGRRSITGALLHIKGGRHEYTADVLGGAQGFNCAEDYRNIAGIMIPARRRVYGYDENKEKIPGPVLVAIVFQDISLY
jgi:hypothetical protein